MSEPTEMERRVAIAIGRAFYNNGMQYDDGTLTDENELVLAVAAIHAMREPTETMCRNEVYESGFRPGTSEYIKQSWRNEYAKIWRAMIDAASPTPLHQESTDP